MATKFVSALTGPEMDQALTDMAYHNSEAYAVGTRNGVAVGSSDVTYHNNSKYWAEQVYGYTDRAEDAANRAEAAVPSGTAGAVFFDRAQTLTTAQQEQVRANIMAGGSNHNLLDNAYFVGGGSQLGDGVFPINQRGQTSYEGGAGIDRWSSDSQITLTASGITISANAIYQNQTKAFFDAILGKTVTYSILTTGGEVKSATIQFPSSYPASVQVQEIFNDGQSSIGFALFPSGNGKVIRIIGVPVAAAKLELGTVSTIANDVRPDFGAELAKCQRYLVVYKSPGSVGAIGFAYAHSTTNATAIITLPVPMIATPTISVVNAIALQQGTVRYNLTSPAGPVLNGNVLTFLSPYTTVSGTAVAGTVGALLLRENATLTISAEP